MSRTTWKAERDGQQWFVVNGKLPGYNDLHKHYITSYRIKRSAMENVGWHIKAARIEPVDCLVDIRIDCYEKHRRRDVDNVFSGACKIIEDSLQRCGILKGDGQKYVRSVTGNVSVDSENPRVEVIIRRAK